MKLIQQLFPALGSKVAEEISLPVTENHGNLLYMKTSAANHFRGRHVGVRVQAALQKAVADTWNILTDLQ